MWHRLSQTARSARRARPISLTVAFGLAAVLVVTSLSVLPAQRARAQTGFSFSYTQITTNPYDQTDPAISGDNIVYTDNRNGNKDIYLYNLNTKTEIDLTPGTPNNQYLEDVSGSNVVYTNVTAQGGSDIDLFDVANSETIPLATGNYDYGPAISGNYATWVHVSETTQAVVLANLATFTSITLTPQGVTAAALRIDGNTVVWAEYVGEYRQIRAYTFDPGDITHGVYRTLTSGACEHRDPDVSGRYVVWADLCNGNWDVYEYDLAMSTGRYLTTATTDQMYPRISGDRVIWEDLRTGISQVWTMDLRDGVAQQVDPSSTSQILNAIDGNHIVWAEPRFGNYDILLATVTQDTTAPTTTAILSPPANSLGWNNSDVTVTLSATDNSGGSGVASITYSATGAQTIGSTTVEGASATVPVTQEGTTTLTYAATDNAGNTEDSKTVTIRIDKTQPTIAITAPVASSATDPAAYSLGQVVAANYSCTDPAPAQSASGASGIATCTGPVASGQPIDTTTGGLHTFTVNATDTAGNTASASVTYFVRYGWGPSGGVLQPINADGSSIFKLGSVVPVKFQLSGIDPNAPPVATLYVQPVSGDVTGSVVEAVSPGQADSGNQFRYDPTAQQYVFNLGTKGLEPGTYTLLIYVGGDKDSGMLLGSVSISLQ